MVWAEYSCTVHDKHNKMLPPPPPSPLPPPPYNHALGAYTPLPPPPAPEFCAANHRECTFSRCCQSQVQQRHPPLASSPPIHLRPAPTRRFLPHARRDCTETLRARPPRPCPPTLRFPPALVPPPHPVTHPIHASLPYTRRSPSPLLWPIAAVACPSLRVPSHRHMSITCPSPSRFLTIRRALAATRRAPTTRSAFQWGLAASDGRRRAAMSLRR